MKTSLKTVEHLIRRARRALQALTLAGCTLLCLTGTATDTSSDRTHHRPPSHRLASTTRHLSTLVATPSRT